MERLHPNITEIVSPFPQGRIVLYLIQGERNAIIDTGTKTTPAKDIAPVLGSMGMTLEDIHLVLNTHGHFDHTGGNYAIKSFGNTEICVHRKDAGMIVDRERYMKEFFAPAAEKIVGKDLMEREWEGFSEMAGPKTGVDRFLEDNDTIDLGAGCVLRVIELPGHTAGSLGFYWEEEGILFSGDSLPGLHDMSGALPILADLDGYIESLDHLSRLPVRDILKAHDFRGIHTPPFSRKRGRGEVKQYLQDCYEVANRLDEAIKALTEVDMEESHIGLYDRIIDLLPKNMNFKYTNELDVPTLFSTMGIYFKLNQRK